MALQRSRGPWAVLPAPVSDFALNSLKNAHFYNAHVPFIAAARATPGT